MLKIRLTRRGKKNKAFFRVVVAEHTSPIKGKFLENLGFLNPHTKEKEFKADRIKYWIEKGAQCSDTVHNLLVSNNVIKGSKRAVKIKKKAVEEKKTESASPADKEAKETEATKPEDKKEETKEVVANEAKKKPAEVKEEKKEEKAEDAKPESKKKEAEKKEGEEPASSAGEEEKK